MFELFTDGLEAGGEGAEVVGVVVGGVGELLGGFEFVLFGVAFAATLFFFIGGRGGCEGAVVKSDVGGSEPCSWTGSA